MDVGQELSTISDPGIPYTDSQAIQGSLIQKYLDLLVTVYNNL